MSRKTFFVSERAGEDLHGLIGRLGADTVCVRSCGIVPDAISSHPDIFMCRMGADDDAPVIADKRLRGMIEAGDLPAGRDVIFASGDALSDKYPFDCVFNAVCTGRYLIHKLDVTAPEILGYAEAHGIRLIDVRQGYTRCSTVVASGDSIITYDKGIARSCEAQGGPDVLLIRPGYVELPGMDTGFIGGASGRIGDAIVFNGDLSAHPDFEAIKRFIEERGLKCEWIPEKPLTDIGSII